MSFAGLKGDDCIVAEARTESSGLIFHLHLVTKHQTKELDSDNSNDYRDADSSDEDAESRDDLRQ